MNLISYACQQVICAQECKCEKILLCLQKHFSCFSMSFCANRRMKRRSTGWRIESFNEPIQLRRRPIEGCQPKSAIVFSGYVVSKGNPLL